MSSIKIENMADEIMSALKDYEVMTDNALKSAVKETAKSVRKEIMENAPKKTGAYRKSWAVKNVMQNSHAIKVVVHSRNRYQIAHLLEKGHTLRNGGRARAFPHIAPAEQHGEEKLLQLLRKKL